MIGELQEGISDEEMDEKIAEMLSKKVPQFRGGGRAFGPHPRDHSIKLTKKLIMDLLLVEV